MSLRHLAALIICFTCLFSCKQKESEQPKKQVKTKVEKQIPPKTIFILHQVSPEKGNCPTPSTTKIPSSARTISRNGSTIKLSPPVKKPADFFVTMKNLKTDNGLTSNNISCGCVDKAGNLWFGTLGGGISKYDGKSFINYTKAQGIASNTIWSILEDKKGNIWIGTYRGGLSRYDGKSITNFTTEHGLASNSVYSIIQDTKGNIWFGTDGGVSRYYPETDIRGESESFINYTTNNGLANNTVNCIREDRNGNIWFGTQGGISVYDGKSFTNYTTMQGLTNDDVESIVEDKTGDLWFGTKEGISLLKNPGNINLNEKVSSQAKLFVNYTTSEGLLNNSVLSMLQDKTGNIWFGTDGGGASRYDQNQTFYNPAAKGSKGAGSYRKSNGEQIQLFTNYTNIQGLSNNKVKCIVEDKDGNIWFGTNGGGINCYNGKSFTNYTVAQGLINNQVYSIIEDKEGSLWFATDAGLSHYDGKNLTNFDASQGMAKDNLRSITEDRNGNLWLGTYGAGAICYNGKSFINYTIDQGLANKIVFSILEDKVGKLWFGTQGGGVSCYDPEAKPSKTSKMFTNYTTSDGLTNNTVRCMTQDKSGNLWFGTDGGGVSRFDGSRIDAIEKGEKYSEINDRDLMKINGKWTKSFTNYTSENGLPNNTIWVIKEDKKGNLWFGTDGGGVSRYDGKSFVNFTMAEGLADNVVNQIVEDGNGKIWLGTAVGFSGLYFKLKPELANSKDGKNRAELIPGVNSETSEELQNYVPVFDNYNSKTGYPIKEINVGKNAMFIDKKGIIWAGTGDDQTGLVRFDPKTLNPNSKPPDVFIQSLKLNEENICWYDLPAYNSNGSFGKAKISGQGVYFDNFGEPVLPGITEEVTTIGRVLTDEEKSAMTKKYETVKFDSVTKFNHLPMNLVLPYDHNNVTFDFAAIDPARQSLVAYQYLLQGYDKDWSPLSSKSTATFGNIPEGTYTFKLKARSSEGIWSEPVLYTFKVLAPWYRTLWMYFIYLLLGLFFIVVIIRWRERKLKVEKEILEAKVELRTKELEEKNKNILGSIHYAKQIQDAMLKEEEDISNHLPEHFILFLPKDIVSGDFHWGVEKTVYLKTDLKKAIEASPEEIMSLKSETYWYLAVVDCTGHGVPGAFMSMLGMSLLNEIVSSLELPSPAEVLNLLRDKVVKELKQTGEAGSNKDGMDISLVRLNLETNVLQWAGANNSLNILQKGELEIVKGDKQPIGYHPGMRSFTNHERQLGKDDLFYIFSDGFADQFGGPKGKKFKYKRLLELLNNHHLLPMREQKEGLNTIFEDWKADLDQVDDVCVIGVRL